ncbi:hypothetical protein CRUP_037147 [Coryphaenoides rupestris]|nr:hypothetical protein CRUP_037147 [Coryphaenoides rupestris]
MAPQGVRGRPGAQRWWPLVCCLSLTATAVGATLAPEEKGPAAATTIAVTDTWNTTTTATTTTTRLQPDLQTEAQTESLTEACRAPRSSPRGGGPSTWRWAPACPWAPCWPSGAATATSWWAATRSAIPRPEDRGLRLAVVASVVSGVVILAMSLAFVICCMQDRRGGRGRSQREGGRSRRRDKRSAAAVALYPQVVLQRVPTPTAPTGPPARPSAPPAPGSSASAPGSSSSSTSNTIHHLQAHLLGHYPTAPGPYPPHHQHHHHPPGVGGPAYPAPIYPNPNPAPQRPWQ